MDKPWLAEYPVSLELAKNLIKHQFPDVGLEKVRQIGEGFDNTVIQLNEEYVFRFPRRPIAVTLIQVENKLLPSLAGNLPLAIPEPVFFGEPSSSYPYPFTGYKMVKGHLPVKETMESKISSAIKFAHFLKVLHGFPVPTAKQLGVQPDGMRRLDVSFRQDSLDEQLLALVGLGYSEQAHAVSTYLKDLDASYEGTCDTLVHGDIHVRNVLLDAQGVLMGIIDWGDVHIGHPAIDFSFLYSYFPKEARRSFFEIYGEIETEVKNLARFRAIYMLVRLLVYGIDRGDKELISLTRTGLSLAMED
ncbi:phosphotransferase [Peribacillus sp. NPDC097284]|uniref:phosphotransferase n=1 Tax=Peribacillus sp. NPDC097284 TaxID=3364401 RepID=UPI003815300E